MLLRWVADLSRGLIVHALLYVTNRRETRDMNSPIYHLLVSRLDRAGMARARFCVTVLWLCSAGNSATVDPLAIAPRQHRRHTDTLYTSMSTVVVANVRLMQAELSTVGSTYAADNGTRNGTQQAPARLALLK